MNLNLITLFNAHPSEQGETYLQHLRVAATFSFWLCIASVACAVHALLPFLCKKTGSVIMTDLHQRMVLHRKREVQLTP
ncbi:MAG: DUF6356 family protein [Pseudomonadota bacterium]